MAKKFDVTSAMRDILAPNPDADAHIAEIITTQEQRDEATLPKRKLVYLNQLLPFPNHPFQVRDDASMQELMDSIERNGIRTPIEVIASGEVNEHNQEQYIIVSGHRRKHVAQALYPPEQRIEVRILDMDLDEATIAMTEANLLTREEILPSERGKAYKMQLDARKRQGSRNDLTSGHDVPKLRPRDQMGENENLSGRQVQRYVRLAELIPKLQEKVDDQTIGLVTAVELSYLKPEEQNLFLEEMELIEWEHKPNTSQAKQLRKLSKAGKLDMDAIVDIVEVKKPNQIERIKYTPSLADIRERIPDFLEPESMNEKEVHAFIEDALSFYKEHLEAEHQKQLQEYRDAHPRQPWERQYDPHQDL